MIIWVICNVLKMPNVHSTLDTILDNDQALSQILGLLQKQNDPLIYECLYLLLIITQNCKGEALMNLIYAQNLFR